MKIKPHLSQQFRNKYENKYEHWSKYRVYYTYNKINEWALQEVAQMFHEKSMYKLFTIWK